MPSISVIVPVYKVESFLHRCVDSILEQSFSDYELILVDDGSPDNCGAICDEYAVANGRVKVIHQKNGGLSAARNAGIDWAFANSDSQWLAFVDSDDWVHKDFLKRLYAAAVDNGCLLSACGFCRTGGEPLLEVGEEPAQCLCADDYYCGDNFSSGTMVVAWNKLYHKSLFQNLRYPVGKLHEDEFTTYQAVYAAGRVGVTRAQLYAYYQNPQGIILSRWNPRRLHILEAFAQQISYAREKENTRLYDKAVRDYIYGIHEQLAASSKEFHRELRAKYRVALKQGRACGVFPLCWDTLWAYEEAYPVKLFWWLLFRGRHLFDRIAGKDDGE